MESAHYDVLFVGLIFRKDIAGEAPTLDGFEVEKHVPSRRFRRQARTTNSSACPAIAVGKKSVRQVVTALGSST
jgi:hypothetical protein